MNTTQIWRIAERLKKSKTIKPHQRHRLYVVGKHHIDGQGWCRHAFSPNPQSRVWSGEHNLLGVIIIEAYNKMEAMRVYRDLKHEK